MAEGADLQAVIEPTELGDGEHRPIVSGVGSAWRANVLASAAAIAELQAARSAWQSVDVPPAGQVLAMIETLLSYAAELTDVLDADMSSPNN